MPEVKRLLGTFASLLLIFTSLFYYLPAQRVSAAVAGHVVISEIQVQSDASVEDEFVELYNPTANAIDLTGWRLTKRSAFSGTDDILVASITGTIPARGFFLIAHASYDGSPVANQLYSNGSNSIANNNSVHLYSDAGTTVVDRVGMGSSLNSEGESIPIPDTGQSIERKAQADSTQISMSVGGAHAALGNGEDTDNNLNDFITRLIPLPQNATSGLEVPPTGGTPTPTVSVTPSATPTPTVVVTPSPTPTATATPTPTVSVTPTATPTVSATPTPSPTNTPTPTATMSPSPTASPTPSPTVTLTPSPTTQPTGIPTPTPTSQPSPTMTPVPSPTVHPSVSPTPQPTPTPNPGNGVVVETPFMVCHWKTLKIKTLFGTFNAPMIVCGIK